ncbi:MAG: hypothetical protein ACI97A_001505 [Planctomycetota bacterium]|jgi:hypothetical protein
MPIRLLLFVTFLLAFSTVIAAQAPKRELGSKAKTDLKKQLTKYARAKKDKDKNIAANGVLKHGRLGIEFLSGMTLKEKNQAALTAIKEMSEKALGLDILKKDEAGKVSDFAQSYISFDEIVLLRKDKVFAGFLLHESPEVASGELTYSWWRQEGPAKKLAQAGGTSGEKITVKGTKAVKPFKPNAGYDEYNYALEIGELKVIVRFIGPAYFLYKLASAPPFCFTGTNKPGKLSSSDKSLGFVAVKKSPIGKLKKKLSTYVFRTVPGAEPLNMEEGDQSAFAQYESVQVEVRRTRLTSSLIVLIRFAEPDAITFEDHMPIFIANFIREILPIEDKNLLIASGSAPSYEANKYWQKGKWVPAKGAITKFLRKNFPEDY